ncbi:DUF6477 family protein [Cognatishimia sp.]|uniref:DUF6477 family protein n=1 Tax=Cognatishimia sp. TaxID=2211648 RepID=UPI0035156883
MDVLQQITALKRPAILVRAAKDAALSYQRKVHLRRFFGETLPHKNATLLAQLLELEHKSNEQRLAEMAEYSVARHLDILIALIGEAQILRASQQ